MPRTDVFSRRTDVFGGSFSADAVRLSFPDVLGNQAGEVGLVIQNLSMQYSQQITRLFEIGTPAQFYVAGRTAGSGSFMRIMGPRTLAKTFYAKYGDVCQAASNNIRLAAGTGCGPDAVITQNISGTAQQLPGGSVALQAYFVVLQSLGINLTADQVVIGESLTFMFSSLDYDTTNVQGLAA